VITSVLRAPFPWYGGKSRAAPLIWRAFGNVPNYVEPFAGSLAVLLARPHDPKVETVRTASRIGDRERIWLSPHCLKVEAQLSLLGGEVQP
jgi:hypothetical protein